MCEKEIKNKTLKFFRFFPLNRNISKTSHFRAFFRQNHPPWSRGGDDFGLFLAYNMAYFLGLRKILRHGVVTSYVSCTLSEFRSNPIRTEGARTENVSRKFPKLKVAPNRSEPSLII